MNKPIVTTREASLRAAQDVLAKLDLQVGPRAYGVLCELVERTPLCSAGMERVLDVSGEMAKLLSDARSHLAPTDERGRDSEGTLTRVEREMKRLALLMRAVGPECQKAVLKRAVKYMLRAERLVKIVYSQISIAIAIEHSRSDRSWHTAPVVGPPKRGRPSKRAEQAALFKEYRELRSLYPTRQKAVDQLNSYHKTAFTVEQVVQWGKRTSKGPAPNASE